MDDITVSTEHIVTSVFDKPLLLNLTRRQSSEILPELLAFLTKHKPHIGQILLGLEHGTWTNNDLRHLENMVVRESNDPGRARDFIRVLRKSCSFYVIRERVSCNLPWIPIVLPQPVNPFHCNLPRMLERYDAWKLLLEARLVEESKNEQVLHNDFGPTAEMLIISAVLYGGLHNIPSLVALIRAIPDSANRTIAVDGRMHIELSLSWRGNQRMELRRWQPDSLTATLWSRMRTERVADLLQPLSGAETQLAVSDRELTKRLSRLLRDVVKRTSSKGGATLGGLAGLLQATQTVAHIELPAVIAAYSSRNLVSHSLRRDVLQRLSKGRIPNAGDPLSENVADQKPELDPYMIEPPESEDLEQIWLKDLRSFMKGKNRNIIRDGLAVRMQSAGASQFALRMTDFCDSLLVVRKLSGKLRSPSTAWTVVQLIARHMEGALSGQDPADLTTEALESLYTQMIESISVPFEGLTLTDKRSNRLREKSDLARALLEFHRYMMGRHKKGPIEDSGYLRAEAGLAAIDANILTFEEYSATLDEIKNIWPSTDYPERKQIAQVLVSLGFSSGLRRMEALRLPTLDLVLGDPVELLIRPMKTRRLKSRNAVRRIPIGLLMTEKGLRDIIEWCDARWSDQSNTPPQFLFGNKREQLDVVPQTIFEQINQIMRKVTGDPTTHFHHLRHSFATWTWLRLMLADMKDPPDLFPHLAMTTAWLQDGPKFREKIYHHGMATRKHAYLLAQLLGHGSPATSMEHYIHFADWLLYLYLERSPLMRPKSSLILLASGKPRQTTARWTLNQPDLAIPLMLWAKRTSRQQAVAKDVLSNVTAPKAIKSLQVMSPSQATWIRRVYDFLYASETSGQPREEVALQYGFDKATGDALWQRAQYVRDLPSGSADHRHRLELYTSDRSQLNAKRVLACPRHPVDPVDKKVIEHFSSILETLAHENSSIVPQALHCYVNHVWNSRNLMVLHNLSEAEEGKDYVELLRRLDIPRKDIRWFSFSRQKRSKSQADWKRSFSLNRHNIIERIKPPNNEGDAAESWFGIAPKFRGQTDKNSRMNPGTFGFRFLMLMGFIAFGPNSEES